MSSISGFIKNWKKKRITHCQWRKIIFETYLHKIILFYEKKAVRTRGARFQLDKGIFFLVLYSITKDYYREEWHGKNSQMFWHIRNSEIFENIRIYSLFWKLNTIFDSKIIERCVNCQVRFHEFPVCRRNLHFKLILFLSSWNRNMFERDNLLAVISKGHLTYQSQIA